MAFSTIIRRAASTVANRGIIRTTTTTQRSYSSSSAIFFSNLSKKNTSSSSLTQELFRGRSFVPTLHFSSSSSAISNKKKNSPTDHLLQVIDDEIKCAMETDDHDRVEEVPAGFPFKIEDKSGEQIITLTRDYKNEVIKVTVHMPDLVTGDEPEDDNDDDKDEDGENGSQSSLPLVVNISKTDCPSLEFSVLAYPDEISIDSLSVKEPNVTEEMIPYEGPDFSDLDENLQKAFHKYLEVRGIKPSATNFLHEYMINKDSKEYLIWLNNLRKFIAGST